VAPVARPHRLRRARRFRRRSGKHEGEGMPHHQLNTASRREHQRPIDSVDRADRGAATRARQKILRATPPGFRTVPLGADLEGETRLPTGVRIGRDHPPGHDVGGRFFKSGSGTRTWLAQPAGMFGARADVDAPFFVLSNTRMSPSDTSTDSLKTQRGTAGRRVLEHAHRVGGSVLSNVGVRRTRGRGARRPARSHRRTPASSTKRRQPSSGRSPPVPPLMPSRTGADRGPRQQPHHTARPATSGHVFVLRRTAAVFPATTSSRDEPARARAPNAGDHREQSRKPRRPSRRRREIRRPSATSNDPMWRAVCTGEPRVGAEQRRGIATPICTTAIATSNQLSSRAGIGVGADGGTAAGPAPSRSQGNRRRWRRGCPAGTVGNLGCGAARRTTRCRRSASWEKRRQSAQVARWRVHR